MIKKTLLVALGAIMLLGFAAGCKPKDSIPPDTPDGPIDTTAVLTEGPICQSCAMPLVKPEDFGTEADGSPSKDYCIHCYADGKFTNPDMTMDDMVAYLAPNWGEWTGKPDMSVEDAKVEVRNMVSNAGKGSKKNIVTIRAGCSDGPARRIS
jgi:hypothetical protein